MGRISQGIRPSFFGSAFLGENIHTQNNFRPFLAENDIKMGVFS
jgi:hypothetical protein